MIDLDGSRIRVNYKDPGDQGDINIAFSKTAGAAVSFNNGGFDGSVISPSRDGYGVQTGFNNGGFDNSQKTLWLGWTVAMHWNLIFLMHH